MKKALIIATVGGFLNKFELGNVKILRQLGVEVHYVSNMENLIYEFDQKKLTEIGLRIHHMPIKKSPFAMISHMQIVHRIAELIEKEEISLIHCHTPVGGYLGRMAARKCSKRDLKVIYTSHGFHFYEGAPLIQGWVFRRVEEYLAHWTDRIVTINMEDYKQACRFRMKPGGAVFRIPGVGLDSVLYRVPDQQDRAACRKDLGIEDDTFFLLSVGELNCNKNHEVILRAMYQLLRNGNDISRIKYGICGEGPQRKTLEKEIREWNLENQVVLYGYCENVREYLAAADGFAFPSRREGLGMAALEALAMGIPVLAADNRGTREYMKDGENGYVYDWQEADGFAQGILKLMEQSEAEKSQMKIACRRSIQPFEKGKTEEIMRKIYETLF